MDKYYFDGVIRLKIKLDERKKGSNINKEELEGRLKKDFEMDINSNIIVLKKHMEKLTTNPNLFALFPYDANERRSKYPLLFIETVDDNYVYIYGNESTSNPHYDCFILFKCHDDVFPKLKSIFNDLEKVFSEKGYILNFYRPNDIEGYLINENKELIQYYQKLSYKTKINLPRLEKLQSFFNNNKIIICILFVSIFILIGIVIFDLKDKLFMNFLSFEDIFIGVIGFLFSQIINLLISYNKQIEEFISSKDLIAYLVADKDISEQKKKTALEIDNINNEKLSID